MPEFDWSPVVVTLKLAAVTTVSLIVVATPLAWWLARTRAWLKPAVESVVSLPLVLPATVLGFYLLLLLGSEGPVGRLWEALGGARLVFSFGGLVVGSMIYSLPFAVQPLQRAFEAIGNRPLEVAATLRASPLDRFFSVAVPLARPGFITAATLAFAHTIGEFGVVLMIGGSVRGQTRVASIAVYEAVETQEYGTAHAISAGLVVFAFVVLFIVHHTTRRRPETSA